MCRVGEDTLRLGHWEIDLLPDDGDGRVDADLDRKCTCAAEACYCRTFVDAFTYLGVSFPRAQHYWCCNMLPLETCKKNVND
jgi:hypothetical protein